MSNLQLTKTKMKQGVWQGILTPAPASGEAPQVEVTHHNDKVENVALNHNEKDGHWLLSIPIPAEAISDGVQTLIIRDVSTDTKLGHVTLMAGEALGDDIRAEMDLLRAELDMLKRAFRRHCLETG